MTSRERIIEVLNHHQPDKLAIDFGAMRSTGIHIQAYDRLKRHLGFSGPGRLYDVFQQLAEPEEGVLNRLGGDVVQAHRLRPAFGIDIRRWREETLYGDVRALVPEGYRPVSRPDGSCYIPDASGAPLAVMPPGGYYFDLVSRPYAGADSEDAIDAVPLEGISAGELDFIEDQVRRLHQTTDRAVLLCFGGNILEAGESDFGFQEFMELLLCEPELAHYYLDRLTRQYEKDLAALLPRVAPYIQVIQFGDDLGSQESSLISPRCYREMIKPYHARLYRYVQNNFPAVKVFLHSCGAIRDLIPDLIDAGVQILNPVQISARGMDPVLLKKEYGNALTFWGGGADMQKIARGQTLAEIKRDVSELIEIFSPGGGFVFNQVHNIQPNIPPDQILAIYDTALAFRETHTF